MNSGGYFDAAAPPPVVIPPTKPPVVIPPLPPPVGSSNALGTITSYQLPALGKSAPFSSNGSSKHVNIAVHPLLGRLFASGGDWTHSATDGTWSAPLSNLSDWRQDVGLPVYPTLPAPHALQDGGLFDWSAKRKQLVLSGGYVPYDLPMTGKQPTREELIAHPLLNYSRGLWYFDGTAYTQDVRLFGVWGTSAGSRNGGVLDDVNDHIVTFGDASGGYACRRWDLTSGTRLPDLPFKVTLAKGEGAYFTHGKPARIGRDVYIVGFRTRGTKASQTPLLLRWNLDAHTMVELSPPPVDATTLDTEYMKPVASNGKVVWPVMESTSELHGIFIYSPATDKWAIDKQIPAVGNFIGNTTCGFPDGRVVIAGGAFGRKQTHLWTYEAK